MTSLTSVDAYRLTVLSGRATSQRERILAFVRTYGAPISRGDIAFAFENGATQGEFLFIDGKAHLSHGTIDFGPPIPLGSVCGRIRVLLDSGLLRELDDHFGRGPQGDKVKLVVAVDPPPKQREMAFPP